jgi:hypothetical protein
MSTANSFISYNQILLSNLLLDKMYQNLFQIVILITKCFIGYIVGYFISNQNGCKLNHGYFWKLQSKRFIHNDGMGLIFPPI